MSLEDCLRYVREAKAAGLSEIGFTGGEPFLFLPVLSKIMIAARDLGISASVTTNAFWAVSEQRALDILRPLKQAGLVCLNLSTSAFHLEFLPESRLIHASNAAHRLGLRVRINCVLSEGFTEATFLKLFESIAWFVEFVKIPCIPAGRAHDFVSITELQPKCEIPEGSCGQHFTKLAITTDGNAYPCCSPGGFTHPLKLGNLNDDNVATIIERAQNSSLHQVLDVVGPAFFAPYIRSCLGEQMLSKTFVDQCHFCNYILSTPQTRSVVLEVADQLDRELKELNISPASIAALQIS